MADTDLQIVSLKRDLTDTERMQFDVQMSGKEKNPSTALILSVLFGCFGVDRFYVGDTGLGVFKLLTFGGFFVWWLIDLFLISGAARKKNVEIGRRIAAGIFALRR